MQKHSRIITCNLSMYDALQIVMYGGLQCKLKSRSTVMMHTALTS